MTQSHDRHQHRQHPSDRPVPAELAAVLAEIVPPGGTFRHRQHIHLAFLAVQRHGSARAPEVVAHRPALRLTGSRGVPAGDPGAADGGR
jgi:hypothetical protein